MTAHLEITRAIREGLAEGRPALIPFITAGYPQPDTFLDSLKSIADVADVVELGVHPKFGATAPKVHRGWQLIRKYGCFGCHEIHGYDSGEPIGRLKKLEFALPRALAILIPALWFPKWGMPPIWMRN